MSRETQIQSQSQSQSAGMRNPACCASLAGNNNNIRQRESNNNNTLKRLSQWFWSGWTTTGTATATATASASTNSRNNTHTQLGNETSPAKPTAYEIENPTDHEAFPCRTCRIRKVECDRLLPRCSHCLDEQLLCFYVEPLRISRKRARDLQLQSSSLRQEQRQMHRDSCVV